jgi:hypothetical protein
MRKGGSIMTNKELQFALDKALEVAKGKEEQIKYLVNSMELLKELHGKEIKDLKHSIKKLEGQNTFLSALVFDKSQLPNHTKAKLTISAIIGIAAGFILALILL